MTIAYAGAPGAFAHEAAVIFAPDRVAIPLADFAAVAEAVASGAAEMGVLPVRNSRAGEVPGVAALLGDARLVVIEERALPVRVHLLALPGVAIDEVVMIASHPVALAQCAEHLAALGIALRSIGAIVRCWRRRRRRRPMGWRCSSATCMTIPPMRPASR
jgi:prephenate dehydratase